MVSFILTNSTQQDHFKQIVFSCCLCFIYSTKALFFGFPEQALAERYPIPILSHLYLISLNPSVTKLQNSAFSFHRLSSSIFTVRSFVCPASVTHPLISTIWCFWPYKPYIFCEDMILATCQHHNLKPYTFQSEFRIVYCCLVHNVFVSTLEGVFSRLNCDVRSEDWCFNLKFSAFSILAW